MVAAIKSREVTTKFGVKKVYDLYDTSGNKYALGFTDPATKGINVSCYVTGPTEVDKYGPKFDGRTITVSATPPVGGVSVAAPDSGSAATPAYSRPAYKDKIFPVPPTHGDMAIIRQNALSNATALVSDYVATLPAEQFPKLDAWSDLVIDVAYKFAKFSSGHRESEAIDKLVKAGVPGTDISSALAAQTGEE
jgi:hypothetical protein